MVLRKVVHIDEARCDGCGQCVPACEEGAIQIVDGKARLVSDVYCDGLGACLGTCPQGAITVEEREALAFDEVETQKHLQRHHQRQSSHGGGCPGSTARTLAPAPAAAAALGRPAPSQLRTWPVQLSLVPPTAPYFNGADLLLVADCVPFALADFHTRFLRGNPVVIGCPKLDDAQFYAQKLTTLLSASDVRSLTVLHMEVPCCSGLVRIAECALAASGKDIPFEDVTIGIGGEVQTPAGLSARQMPA